MSSDSFIFHRGEGQMSWLENKRKKLENPARQPATSVLSHYLSHRYLQQHWGAYFLPDLQSDVIIRCKPTGGLLGMYVWLTKDSFDSRANDSRRDVDWPVSFGHVENNNLKYVSTQTTIEESTAGVIGSRSVTAMLDVTPRGQLDEKAGPGVPAQLTQNGSRSMV
jgi:hypothetical protein